MLHTGPPLSHRLTWPAILVERALRIVTMSQNSVDDQTPGEDYDLSGPGIRTLERGLGPLSGLRIRTSLT